MTVSRSYVWVFLAPFIFWLAKRFSFAGETFWISIAVHAVGGLLFAAIKWEVDHLTGELTHTISNGSSVVAYQLDVLIYCAIVGMSLAFYYHRFYSEYQKSMLLSSKLETRLAQTHLQVLRMQLHPHFLFNTLNAISTLVYKDPSAADRMISRLGQLLRFVVDSIRLEEIPLCQEIMLLETYLDIERTRFGDRLQVTLQLDRCANNAKVPSLILQPLVENAIQHGVGRRARGGRIDVRTRLAGSKVEIEIQDDGLGFIPRNSMDDREGIGLANTRSRLQALYGEGYKLECTQAPEQGALVKVTIPYSPAEIPK
jgi:sensor histidine kinase YesM